MKVSKSMLALLALAIGVCGCGGSKDSKSDSTKDSKTGTDSGASDNKNATGSFKLINSKKTLTGSYKIVTEGDVSKLVLSEDFSASKGPDVRVMLFTEQVAEIGTSHTPADGAIDLGNLELNSAGTAYEGAQTFNIPAGTDLSKYKSVAIHCFKYNAPWGAAPLGEQTLLYKGDFFKVNTAKELAGNYQIKKVDGKTVLELSSDFVASKGPDVRVMLFKEEAKSILKKFEPTDAVDLGVLALEDGATEYKGVQTFTIPDGTDLSKFKAVVIFCFKFNATWGAAPLNEQTVSHSGTFELVNDSKTLKGSFLIKTVDDVTTLVLSDDFEASKGPDVRVLLFTEELASIGKSHEPSDPLDLGNLTLADGATTYKGPQTFTIPSGTDLSKYKSVAIHCYQFNAPWGAATIPAN